MKKPMQFVVMGDTHYVQPDVHQRALNGHPKGVTEVADVTRNYWMTQHVLPDAIAQIAALRPEFIIQTGDIIQGHCDDEQGCIREMKEALEMLEGLHAPVFFTLGTHDGIPGRPGGQAVEQLVYPAIGKALGRDITEGYYAFERDGSLFVFLDYTTFAKGDAQAAFMKETFGKSEAYEHVFVFAHPPLLPVGRPFFTSFEFAAALLEELSRCPVDAYFCGHTHNQIASLHRMGSYWLPHLKSTVLGYPDEPPVSLTDVRQLLPDPLSFEYGWGYLEDSAPGWWLITVEGEEVQADWHVLNQGPVGQLRWRRGEKAQFVKKPKFFSTRTRSLPPLNQIRAAQLRAAGDSCRSAEEYRVFLNGVQIGSLPRLEYFDGRQFLNIDSDYLALIKDVNRIEVGSSDTDAMTIGGFVLEVQTADGWVRSSVSDFYTSSTKWDRWGQHPLHKVNAGATVTVELRFDNDR